jgi:spore maturation protein CgeB
VRFVIFTHSLVSDWNHGNAHFLRGIASELLSRGHHIEIFEPEDGWSRQNLLRDHGQAAIDDFQRAFPHLHSTLYQLRALDLAEALRGADVVIVHEWNPPELIERIGRHRGAHDYQLFFHDTHHRSLSDRNAIAQYDLSHFDGVLAYGGVIRDTYLAHGWARYAWTWHEAADTRVFQPLPSSTKDGDLVWIGNWGDDERADSLRELLIKPVKKLGLRARVYGVRYPQEALQELASAGIEYAGWLPNHRVPEVFARYRVTIHVPRRPYVEALPGIPTIRPFEAMACGIPLISGLWSDSEALFSPGEDFLFARDSEEMISQIKLVMDGPQVAARLAAHGLRTIRNRHTCAHRVDELFSFIESPVLMGAERRALECG